MAVQFKCRRATIGDDVAVASVFSPSLRLFTFRPMLHTVEEDRWFVENMILNECEVTVAEGESGIVSFLARNGEAIRLLYTHPAASDRLQARSLSKPRQRAAPPRSSCGAFKPTSATEVSAKPETFARYASQMARTTRRECWTFATAGSVGRGVTR